MLLCVCERAPDEQIMHPRRVPAVHVNVCMTVASSVHHCQRSTPCNCQQLVSSLLSPPVRPHLPHRPLSQAGHAACACCGAGERRAIAGCFAGVLLARRALSPTERAHEVSRASPPLHYTYAGHGHSTVARTKPTPADTWGPRTERAHVSSASVLRQTRCHRQRQAAPCQPRPKGMPFRCCCLCAVL